MSFYDEHGKIRRPAAAPPPTRGVATADPNVVEKYGKLPSGAYGYYSENTKTGARGASTQEQYKRGFFDNPIIGTIAEHIPYVGKYLAPLIQKTEEQYVKTNGEYEPLTTSDRVTDAAVTAVDTLAPIPFANTIDTYLRKDPMIEAARRRKEAQYWAGVNLKTLTGGGKHRYVKDPITGEFIIQTRPGAKGKKLRKKIPTRKEDHPLKKKNPWIAFFKERVPLLKAAHFEATGEELSQQDALVQAGELYELEEAQQAARLRRRRRRRPPAPPPPGPPPPAPPPSPPPAPPSPPPSPPPLPPPVSPPLPPAGPPSPPPGPYLPPPPAGPRPVRPATERRVRAYLRKNGLLLNALDAYPARRHALILAYIVMRDWLQARRRTGASHRDKADHLDDLRAARDEAIATGLPIVQNLHEMIRYGFLTRAEQQWLRGWVEQNVRTQDERLAAAMAPFTPAQYAARAFNQQHALGPRGDTTNTVARLRAHMAQRMFKHSRAPPQAPGQALPPLPTVAQLPSYVRDEQELLYEFLTKVRLFWEARVRRPVHHAPTMAALQRELKRQREAFPGGKPMFDRIAQLFTTQLTPPQVQTFDRDVLRPFMIDVAAQWLGWTHAPSAALRPAWEAFVHWDRFTSGSHAEGVARREAAARALQQAELTLPDNSPEREGLAFAIASLDLAEGPPQGYSVWIRPSIVSGALREYALAPGALPPLVAPAPPPPVAPAPPAPAPRVLQPARILYFAFLAWWNHVSTGRPVAAEPDVLASLRAARSVFLDRPEMQNYPGRAVYLDLIRKMIRDLNRVRRGKPIHARKAKKWYENVITRLDKYYRLHQAEGLPKPHGYDVRHPAAAAIDANEAFLRRFEANDPAAMDDIYGPAPPAAAPAAAPAPAAMDAAQARAFLWDPAAAAADAAAAATPARPERRTAAQQAAIDAMAQEDAAAAEQKYPVRAERKEREVKDQHDVGGPGFAAPSDYYFQAPVPGDSDTDVDDGPDPRYADPKFTRLRLRQWRRQMLRDGRTLDEQSRVLHAILLNHVQANPPGAYPRVPSLTHVHDLLGYHDRVIGPSTHRLGWTEIESPPHKPATFTDLNIDPFRTYKRKQRR